jgi:hypothetical protein
MTPELAANVGELNAEVVEHRVRIENLDKTAQRIETRLDHLLWAMLCMFATSAGTLLVMLLKH